MICTQRQDALRGLEPRRSTGGSTESLTLQILIETSSTRSPCVVLNCSQFHTVPRTRRGHFARIWAFPAHGMPISLNSPSTLQSVRQHTSYSTPCLRPARTTSMCVGTLPQTPQLCSTNESLPIEPTSTSSIQLPTQPPNALHNILIQYCLSQPMYICICRRTVRHSSANHCPLTSYPLPSNPLTNN